MFKIHAYTEKAEVLFIYESDILPMVGDRYVNPDNTDNHYEVVKRLLHVKKDVANVISIWVKKTS